MSGSMTLVGPLQTILKGEDGEGGGAYSHTMSSGPKVPKVET